MLLPLGGETLIARGYRIACEAFGREHVIVAIPASDCEGPLALELFRIGAPFCGGPEDDVLGRFVAVALSFRSDPTSVIVRYTPDDPFKDVESLRAVAAGARDIPVEIGGEAFTLGELLLADRLIDPSNAHLREHIGYVFNPNPPKARGWWRTIDTPEDYAAAKALVEEQPATGWERAVWDAERGAVA
jgi:spore coat polysaccharide biosynthesis protein SpsF (cytidylyltransferase family)